MNYTERHEKVKAFLDANRPIITIDTDFSIDKEGYSNILGGIIYAVSKLDKSIKFRFVLRDVEDVGLVLNPTDGGLYFNKWDFFKNNPSSFFDRYDHTELSENKVRQFLELPNLYKNTVNGRAEITLLEYSAYVFLARQLGFNYE